MSNKSKNIWVINQFAGSPNSGWGERHYFLSRKWLDKGYKVTVISSTYNHMFKNFAIDKEQFNFEDVNGTQFCWIKTPKYNPQSVLRFWAMLVFAIKAYFVPISKAGKPDIIIVSSMPIFPSLTGWLLKKRYKTEKFIFEVRDLWPLTPMYLMGFSKWHPVIMFISFFEKIGYKKSDYIVSLLPNAGSYINVISKNPYKFKWIPNGIDERLLKSEDLPEDILQMIPKDKFIVGYTGTMGMANALEYFAEASQYIKEKPIHLVFVGEGYLKGKLQELTKTSSNVSFIPRISKNQVQTILELFDVCFIGRNNTPLFDYGVSSNKYFDYMLSKKPVLVSSNHIKDPVELSDCGIIVNPDDAKAIADGIIQLYSISNQEREAMGKRGYEYVKKYHNFEYLSEKYLDLFQ